jgi:hypothetical protein
MHMTRFGVSTIGISRRKALPSGACALAGVTGLLLTKRVYAGTNQSATYEEIVGAWYKAWEKDQPQFESLMADNFTFTSAAGRDP